MRSHPLIYEDSWKLPMQFSKVILKCLGIEIQNPQYSFCLSQVLTLEELSVLDFLKDVRKTHAAFQTTTP